MNNIALGTALNNLVKTFGPEYIDDDDKTDSHIINHAINVIETFKTMLLAAKIHENIINKILANGK